MKEIRFVVSVIGIMALIGMTELVTTVSAAQVVRTAARVVAAYNSDLIVKAQADYVCDGTDDNVEIQQAMDSISRGEIKLLAGDYNIGSTILFKSGSKTLSGEAPTATVLKQSDNKNLSSIISVDSGVTAYNCMVKTLKIDGNKANNPSSGYGIDATNFAGGSIFENVLVDNAKTVGWYKLSTIAIDCRASNCGTSGFVLQEGARALYCVSANNVDGFVIDTGNIWEVWLIGCETGQNSNRGYVAWGAHRARFLSCLASGDTGSGFVIGNSSYQVTVQNCQAYLVGAHGFDMSDSNLSIIDGCTATNCSDSGGNYSGILINRSKNCVISNNTVWGEAAPAKMYYGIAESGTADYNVITSNNVYGNFLAGKILKAGANTIVRDNIGIITENKGTATINSGSTSVVVNHGCDVTPSRVLVTPTSDPKKRYWVDTITSTQFTIHTDSNPLANVTFDWYAIAY